MPRRDVKPLAKALIAPLRLLRRGDRRAARAPAGDRRHRRGGRAELKIVEAAARRLAKRRDRASGRCSAPGSTSSIIAAPRWPSRETEEFRILFLDKRNGLIADEVQSAGTVDHTPVYPREIVKRALELSAHGADPRAQPPSGDPTPSSADIRMTQEIVNAPSRSASSARPHHRRPPRACELEGDEAVLVFADWAKASCHSRPRALQGARGREPISPTASWPPFLGSLRLASLRVTHL